MMTYKLTGKRMLKRNAGLERVQFGQQKNAENVANAKPMAECKCCETQLAA